MRHRERRDHRHRPDPPSLAIPQARHDGVSRVWKEVRSPWQFKFPNPVGGGYASRNRHKDRVLKDASTGDIEDGHPDHITRLI